MHSSLEKNLLVLLLIPLAAVLCNSFSGNAATEIPGTTVTLTSAESSVEFNRIEWNPKQKVTVALRLETRSIKGQLMVIKGVAQDTYETAFELSLVLKRQDLNVYLHDEFHAIIAQAENVKNGRHFLLLVITFPDAVLGICSLYLIKEVEFIT